MMLQQPDTPPENVGLPVMQALTAPAHSPRPANSRSIDALV